jgi:hypothetical protein
VRNDNDVRLRLRLEPGVRCAHGDLGHLCVDAAEAGAWRTWTSAPGRAEGCEPTQGAFSSFKVPKILQDSLSHRIFRRMHGVLNVGKKNN